MRPGPFAGRGAYAWRVSLSKPSRTIVVEPVEVPAVAPPPAPPEPERVAAPPAPEPAVSP